VIVVVIDTVIVAVHVHVNPAVGVIDAVNGARYSPLTPTALPSRTPSRIRIVAVDVHPGRVVVCSTAASSIAPSLPTTVTITITVSFPFTCTATITGPITATKTITIT
jgi:hypothetical protein